MALRRVLAILAGVGFFSIAGWASIAVVFGIQRQGNATQLLLASLGVLAAVCTWTLIDLVERLPKPATDQE